MFVLSKRDFRKKYHNTAFSFGYFHDFPKEVEPADEIVKYIFPEAVYMTLKNKGDLCIFERAKTSLKHVGIGHLYRYYFINGKLYETFYTSKYKDLVRACNILKEKKKYRQMSLF